MLRKFRILIATLFMAALTVLFLDYTGTVHAYLIWMAKLQFVPAILAGSVIGVVGVLLLTLVFGRIYCSAICPLGICQDVVSWKASWFLKKNRFGYRPPRKFLVVLRFVILAVFVAGLLFSIAAVSNTLEPYSAFGRMVSQIFGPVYKYGNNILAGFSERAGTYTFYPTDIWLKSMGALVLSIVTLAVITVFAAKSGRGYCNTICPVGTLLAVVTKFSFVKLPINKEKCNGCGLCARNCKAGCIDPVNKEIDPLRCVSCFNCMGICPKNAISFSFGSPFGNVKKTGEHNSPIRHGSDINAKAASSSNTNDTGDDGMTRRGMLSTTATLALGIAAGAVARTYDFDGGLAPLEDKVAPKRSTPIIPPGADSLRNFRKRCTGCQLCVTVCPNQVLRPYKATTPHMSFERGYCRPECVKCSQVCPTGAIRPITTAEKSSIQIGIAVRNKDLCVITTDNVPCDLCSRKCPTGAITMINLKANDETSPKIPMIDEARCIGCGACEQLCPARPLSAIHVEGVETHRTI